jgi:fucose permease
MSIGTIRTHTTMLFGICCLAYIANGLLSVLPSSSLTILAKDTHVSLSAAGLIFTLSSFGTIIAVLLSSYLIKKFGAKPIILLGLGGIIVASVITPMTQQFNLWLIAQLIQGLSNGFISIGLTITITLNFKDQLNEKLNMLYAANGIGSLLAPILLSWALSLTRSPFMAFITVALCAAISLLVIYGLRFTSNPHTHNMQSRPLESTTFAHSSTSKIFKQTMVWFIALQVCLYVGAESGFSNWLVTSISQSADVTLQMATPAAMLFWIGETTGRLLVAQMMKWCRLTNSQILYICIIGGSASGTVVTAFINIPFICFIGSFCAGVLFGPIYPMLQSMATRRFAQMPTAISSVVIASSGFAGMTIPVSIGLLIPDIGIRGGMFIPALLCLAIMIPLYLADKKEYQQSIVYGQNMEIETADVPFYELPTVEYELPILEFYELPTIELPRVQTASLA